MIAAARRARVLVVDDDTESAAVLGRVLETAGFEVASVRTLRVATRVLLDEDVPVVVVGFARRGISATTELVETWRARPEPALHGAGIVALVDASIDADFGLRADADAVLVRPFGAQELADVVTEVAATDPEARIVRRSATVQHGAYFQYRWKVAVG